MPSSDEIKDLCVEEFPESKSKDWKRIHKFKVDCAGIVRVFDVFVYFLVSVDAYMRRMLRPLVSSHVNPHP